MMNRYASCLAAIALVGLLGVNQGGAQSIGGWANNGLLYGAGNVASGTQSAAGGVNNTASGAWDGAFGNNNLVTGGQGAYAFGNNNISDGSFSFTFGNNAGARGRIGVVCFSSQALAANADAQGCTQTLRGTGAAASAIRLTTDSNAAGGTNCILIPNNAGYAVTATIVAFDHTTVTKNATWLNWGALLTRGANAASTAIVAQTTPTPLTNGTLTGQAIAMTADTTNGCLNISYTPPTGNTDTFNVVAYVQTVEVQ